MAERALVGRLHQQMQVVPLDEKWTTRTGAL